MENQRKDPQENPRKGPRRIDDPGRANDARPALWRAGAEAASADAGWFGAPRLTGPTISDNVTGIYAAYGILTALLDRERGGKPRRVDVNMLDATLAFMPDPFGYYTQMNLESDPYLRVRTSQSYVFRCADDRMVNVHMSSQEKFWTGFVEAIGRPELAEDPRFATRSDRIANYFDLDREAASVFVGKPLAEWEARLGACDVPFAAVNTIPEALEDPQVRHLGSFMALEHPAQGQVRAVRNPVWMDGSRDLHRREAPPVLGEHTEEVLREIGKLPAGSGSQ